MFKLKNKKGFTLVELLIVVVILGILATVAIPKFLTTQRQAEFRSCQSNLAAINAAIEEWSFMNPGQAVVLATITGDNTRFPDGAPTCPDTTGVYSLLADGTDRVDCSVHGSIATPIPPA